MNRYTDHHLDYWGERFVHEQIRERLGITFEQFLRGPAHYVIQARSAAVERFASLQRQAEHLAATTDRAAIGDFEPLLDRQRDAANRAAMIDDASAWAERQLRGLPRRNGAAIEKLAHHRFPKSTAHFGAHQEHKS